MPDKYMFNILGQEVACVYCPVRGFMHEFPGNVRREHFETFHSQTIVQRNKIEREKRLAENPPKEKQIFYKVREENGVKLRVDKCAICENEFTQEIKRGRPAVKCKDCR